MDETTWSDGLVGEWVEEHAVAIKVDVDEEPDVAKAYDVDSLPTIVVIRGGEEFDRVVGYRDGAELLGWLDGVLEGRRERDRLREAMDDKADAVNVDVMARFELARGLGLAGLDDEASEHYLWLWENSLKHFLPFYGVRVSFMASEIEKLAARHEPTLTAFESIFEREHEAIDQGVRDQFTWTDWIALGTIAQRQIHIVRWVLEHRDADGALSEVPSHAHESLTDLLVEHGRIAEAAGFFPSLIKQAKTKAAEHATIRKATIRTNAEDQVEAEVIEEMLQQSDPRDREQLLLYHRMAYAAGRANEANCIEVIILHAHDDDTTRIALARQALEGESVGRRHVQLATEALAAAESEADARLVQQLIEELRAAVKRTGRLDGDRLVRSSPGGDSGR